MNLMDIIVWLLIVLAAVGILLTIVTGRISNRHTGIANLTVFHDFQPKDKQEAVEVIVETKSGKQWSEQKSGDTDNPDHDSIEMK